jgi:hypothetical protein
VRFEELPFDFTDTAGEAVQGDGAEDVLTEGSHEHLGDPPQGGHSG